MFLSTVLFFWYYVYIIYWKMFLFLHWNVDEPNKLNFSFLSHVSWLEQKVSLGFTITCLSVHFTLVNWFSIAKCQHFNLVVYLRYYSRYILNWYLNTIRKELVSSKFIYQIAVMCWVYEFMRIFLCDLKLSQFYFLFCLIAYMNIKNSQNRSVHFMWANCKMPINISTFQANFPIW